MTRVRGMGPSGPPGLAAPLTAPAFGMKNKKGGKAQKFAAQVQAQAANAGKNKEAVGVDGPV